MTEEDWRSASQALADDLTGFYGEEEAEVADPVFVLVIGADATINLRTALSPASTVAMLPQMLRSVADSLEGMEIPDADLLG